MPGRTVMMCLAALLLFSQHGSALPGGDPVSEALHPLIASSLNRSPRDEVREAVQSARERIRAVVYKFTDPAILETLLEAEARGVDVRVLCDANEAAEKKSLVGRLASSGATIRLWDRRRGKLHAKFLIVDSHAVLTGSYNWTLSGSTSNVEILLRLEDENSVERFGRIFDDFWEKGRAYR